MTHRVEWEVVTEFFREATTPWCPMVLAQAASMLRPGLATREGPGQGKNFAEMCGQHLLAGKADGSRGRAYSDFGSGGLPD